MNGIEKKMHVVLVDDDELFLESLQGALADRGFAVSPFVDGTALLNSPDVAAGADVIILDWSLPDLAGPDLLYRLRAAGIATPVIFLTGRTTIENEHLALDGGAIDFLDKARGVDVLVRRLGRIAPGSIQARPSVVLPRGRLTLVVDQGRVEWRGRDIEATITEYRVIELLVAAGSWVTSRSIYDCMHYSGFNAGQGEFGYLTNVRSTIKRIRRKFRAVDPTFDQIVNNAGTGYRWLTPADDVADVGTPYMGDVTSIDTDGE
jgi:two-component system response regulator ChvI